MVKRTIDGTKIYHVNPASGAITEVTVERSYRAGKPHYEACLLVLTSDGSRWDVFASSAFRRRQDAEIEAARVLTGPS